MDNEAQSKSIWVVIPAAGVGRRMQSDIPKQYLKIQGKTVLEHTVSRFTLLPQVAGVLVIVSEADAHWNELESTLVNDCRDKETLLMVTYGGVDRSSTVAKGLAFLLDEKKLALEQWVMIHDAARPCVLKADLLNLMSMRQVLNKDSGAILAIPVRDTLKQAGDDKIVLTTQSRDALWQAQTPQLFTLGVLYDALNKASHAGVLITDDASALEYDRKQVHLVEGSSSNIKLTTPSDLAIIEFLLKGIEGKDAV